MTAKRVLFPVRRLVAGGGLEIQTVVIAEQLAQRGWDVRVRFEEGGDLQPRWESFSECQSGPVNRAAMAGELSRSELLYIHEPDISADLHPLASAGQPIVTHLHFPPEHLRSGLRSAVKGRFRTDAEKAAFGRHTHFKAFIGVSDFTAQQWLTGGLPRSVMHVVHNGLDPTRFTPGVRPTQRRPPLKVSDRVVLGYLGRIDTRKGIEVAIEVAHSLRHSHDVELIVIGGPTDGAGAQGLRYMEELRSTAPPNVRWRGRQHDAQSLLVGIDILLVPSRWGEPFGLVAAEAMHCGAVPVVYRDGGLPEVLGGQLQDNVVDKIPAAMTARVRFLVENRSALNDAQRRGYERADQLQASSMTARIDAIISGFTA